MGWFQNLFPYTNFHDINLDWIIKKLGEIESAFPEGIIGIPKGGTGATTAAQARENLEIRGDTIPKESGSADTVSAAIDALSNSITQIGNRLHYVIYRTVTDMGLTPGTTTIASAWVAMSPGEMLVAAPSEFANGECPEAYGVLVLVRAAGSSGYCRFYGTGTHEKPFANNYPSNGWVQLRKVTDVIPVSLGGTGATTPEEARENLGIDFTGTVLSVAGVGANTAGNVPLVASDLGLQYIIYKSITECNLVPGNAGAVNMYNAMAQNSIAIIPSSEVNDALPAGGIVQIVKGGESYIAYMGAGVVMLYDFERATWTTIPDYNRFITQTVSVTLPATEVNGVINSNVALPVIAGYSAIAVAGYVTSGSGATTWNITGLRISGDNLAYQLRATATLSASTTLNVIILYYKN